MAYKYAIKFVREGDKEWTTVHTPFETQDAAIHEADVIFRRQMETGSYVQVRITRIEA
jgi:hypothetical protein